MQLADVVSRLVECGLDLSRTKLPLIENRASMELRHVGIGVPDVPDDVRALVHVQRHLGGRGTGIDGKDLEFTGLQKSPPGRWSSPCHPRSPPAMESGPGPSRRPPRART